MSFISTEGIFSANQILYRVLTIGFGDFGAWPSRFSSHPAPGESLGLAKFYRGVCLASPGLPVGSSLHRRISRRKKQQSRTYRLNAQIISNLTADFPPRSSKRVHCCAVHTVHVCVILELQGSPGWLGPQNTSWISSFP